MKPPLPGELPGPASLAQLRIAGVSEELCRDGLFLFNYFIIEDVGVPLF
ncbi:MAG TPA: hypothetical protein VNL71_05430 [Chloroflexota bacterium]|nr:hypothetical protein [Chloroflexota bacterium]